MAVSPVFAVEDGVGYVRFVNAIGLDGRMTLSMNGEVMNAKGYRAGEYTGGVGLKAGDYTFIFAHPLMEKLETNLRVIDGVSVTCILYAKPKLDKNGELFGYELAAYEMEQTEKEGRSVTVVSLCVRREELPLQVMAEGAGKPLDLSVAPLKPEKVSFRRGGDFVLVFEKQVIASMTMVGRGDYVAVVYDRINERGGRTVKAALFPYVALSGRL